LTTQRDSKNDSIFGARRQIRRAPISWYAMTRNTIHRDQLATSLQPDLQGHDFDLQGHKTGVPIAVYSSLQFVATLWRFGRNQGKAEAKVVAPDRRDVPATDRRPATCGNVAPTAATEHANRDLPWSNGIANRNLGIFTVAVAAPLPNIAVHVVKAPGVGFPLTDRMRLIDAVSTKPSIVAQ
jgi:hypothetical protein